MPYESVRDLPKQVQENLPTHAKEIYKEAFNNAWEQYHDPKDRRGDSSREEVAHKVAWNAVKQKYKKQGNNWIEK